MRSSTHDIDPRLVLVVETADLFGLLEHLGLKAHTVLNEAQVPTTVYLDPQRKSRAFFAFPPLGAHVPHLQLHATGSQLEAMGLMPPGTFTLWVARHQKEKVRTQELCDEVRIPYQPQVHH